MPNNSSMNSDSVFVKKLQNRTLSEMTPSDTNSKYNRDNVNYLMSEKNYVNSYVNTQSDAIPKNYMANRKQFGGRRNYDSSVESSQYSDMNTESADSMYKPSKYVESSYDEDDVTGSTKYNNKMSRSKYAISKGNKYDTTEESDESYDDNLSSEQYDASPKLKRTSPESFKKRQEFRRFLKENDISGGIEIASLMEKYINESGIDKKENLDKAIDAAKKKILKDKSNGSLDKIIEKIKLDMKNKREAKKKSKQN